MNKKILFLGYNNNQTSLISFLKNKKIKVVEHNQKSFSYSFANRFDCVISFGYRKIVKKNTVLNLKKPIINLHISYLPYNRGSHPNFWSFVDRTPKGVSIHEIDSGIDTGKVIYRKKINFRYLKNHTFKTTYKKLFLEAESLFKKNYKKIINKDYHYIKIKKKGTYHAQKNLPKNINNWNIKIIDYLCLNKI